MAAVRPRADLGTATVLTAWCLLALGDSAREGEFSPWALALVLTGFVLLVAAVVSRAPLTVPDRRLLALPAAVCVAAAVVHPVTRYMHVSGGRLVTIQILAVVTATAAGLALLAPAEGQRPLFWLLLGAAAVSGVVVVLLVTDPSIDVWYLLQQSSTGLLHGLDMYRQHWARSHGLQAVYPYLPGTTVLLAPFRWLAGDVRFGLVTALLVSAVVVRRLAPQAPVTLAALVLVFPHWSFLVDQSWTEPLLLAALAAAILALKERRPTLAVVALAVAFACKQHIVLLLPLFALWPSFGVRRTAASAGLAGLIVLPWFIAGPRDMWHDAVHANLALGVLPRALCLPSLFSRWHVTVGFWFLLLVLAGAYAVVVRCAPRTPAGLAVGCALVLWALDLANKQSFFNHYTLPLGLLVVALAAAPGARA